MYKKFIGACFNGKELEKKYLSIDERMDEQTVKIITATLMNETDQI